MYEWLQVGHILGVILWIGGLFTVYWLLRFHTHAPKEVHEKLTLIERAVALSTDLAATLAMVCGIVLIFENPKAVTTGNLLTVKGAGWLHIKLTVVVLGVIGVHGFLRARVGKYSRGQVTGIPQWIWSALLVAITTIVIMVFRGPKMFG